MGQLQWPSARLLGRGPRECASAGPIVWENWGLGVIKREKSKLTKAMRQPHVIVAFLVQLGVATMSGGEGGWGVGGHLAGGLGWEGFLHEAPTKKGFIVTTETVSNKKQHVVSCHFLERLPVSVIERNPLSNMVSGNCRGWIL